MNWDNWVLLAEIVRARGVKGEVVSRLETTDPSQLHSGRKVYLAPVAGTGEPREMEIEHAWEHQGRWILKFAGIDSIPAAEALRGQGVLIPAGERRPLEEGEYFLNDLIGCRVVDRRTGEQVGTVEGWEDIGGPILLAVRDVTGAEMLVPFNDPICPRVDLPEKVIEVELPDGLRELNRP